MNDTQTTRPARRIGDVLAIMIDRGEIPGLRTHGKRAAVARRIDSEVRTKRNRQACFDFNSKT